MPSKADVVADTVNVFEAIKAEAVDVADNTKDKAKATDATGVDEADVINMSAKANEADAEANEANKGYELKNF